MKACDNFEGTKRNLSLIDQVSNDGIKENNNRAISGGGYRIVERESEKRKFLLYYTRFFDTRSHVLVGNLVDIISLRAKLVKSTLIRLGVDFNLKLK